MTHRLPILASAAPNPAATRGHIAIRALASGAAELLIYGPIGAAYWDGITAARIVEQLGRVSAGTLHVRINSEGGDAPDGIAIYNALKQHPATKIVMIDGVAESIASLIAMAGDEIVMPATALMMLHLPWTPYATGNANDLRQAADQLDTFARAMAEAYAARTGKNVDEILALLGDGANHWYSAADAVAFGLADRVLEDSAAPEIPDPVAAVALLGYVSAIAKAPDSIVATLRRRIQAAVSPPIFAALPAASQPAVMAYLEDESMRQQCLRIMAGQPEPPTGQPATPAATPATPPATAANPASTPAVAAAGAGDVLAALAQRNERIRGVFAGFREIGGVAALEAECLADPTVTVEAAQSRLLGRVGALAQPLAGGGRTEAGADDSDRLREAGVSALMARAGLMKPADAERARQGNPYANMTLVQMAERALIRAGVNTRDLSRDEIARRVLAQGTQTTSDFPVLLENTLHKMLIGGYNLAAFTWDRFCTTGTLSDYRPHNRYHLSSFSDLKPVNEAGEYENGVLGDGEKETIKGARKGRILTITPEVLVNDDLGAIARIASALGQAAGRTIEKDVYALFALNAGAGPVMGDGKALFHASHNNIAATAGAPSVVLIDAARMQMAQQMDPAGNDYLDIVPAVFLGPLALGSEARVLNEAQYDVGVSNKFQVPNRVRGLFREVVDTPRLAGTAWYMFAAASIEPVFEVAFLDGVQTPVLQQEIAFRTDGLSWKVVHKYGVAAIGWRGVVKNAGA